MINRNKERVSIAFLSTESTAQKPLHVDKVKVVIMHMVASAAKYVIWFCMPSKQKTGRKKPTEH